jgi:beta-N-acetylhexosaminidase
MVAHAAFPSFDLQEIASNGKLLPSSLSYNFVTKLLRSELGFQGVILSDDLEMGAITKNFDIGEACKLAVSAGENMLVICSNPNFIREGFSTVLNAVKKGEIPESQIDDSICRIANLKSIIQPPLPLNMERLHLLSDSIAELNKQLNYSYGG